MKENKTEYKEINSSGAAVKPGRSDVDVDSMHTKSRDDKLIPRFRCASLQKRDEHETKRCLSSTSELQLNATRSYLIAWASLISSESLFIPVARCRCRSKACTKCYFCRLRT